MNMINCAIIGSGNIGTDLAYKLMRSNVLRPVWMVGIEPDSEGLAIARELGIKTTAEGVDGLIPHVAGDEIRIAFDATSAYAHAENFKKLDELNVFMIDLTPAAIGPYCVPPVNLEMHIGTSERNLNMVSCGGQATIPIVHAIARVQPVSYAEIVATAASKSLGPGTRKNIDEFTRTTSSALCKVGGAREGKAIVVVNPAEPPIMMRDTVYCETETSPDQAAIEQSVYAMVAEVKEYVPGYVLKNGPIFEDNRVSVFLEIEGRGDFLPRYAGNLDIMTASAVQVAERLASHVAKREYC